VFGFGNVCKFAKQNAENHLNLSQFEWYLESKRPKIIEMWRRAWQTHVFVFGSRKFVWQNKTHAHDGRRRAMVNVLPGGGGIIHFLIAETASGLKHPSKIRDIDGVMEVGMQHNGSQLAHNS